MMRVAVKIELSEAEKQKLEKLANSPSTSVRLAERSRIVLLAAQGLTNQKIGWKLGISMQKVSRWRGRYAERGLAGIEKDAPRPGRLPSIGQEQVTQIVEWTTQTQPDHATHWSQRSMAERAGVSPATVARIWRGHGLKPHLARTFKLSNDPKFAEKLEDVVGLYLSPPDNAIVLSCDEKSSIQALDRTQPGLPIKKGRAATMTHDYKRHGTTTLFAALDTMSGEVLSRCANKHRHQEWLAFLRHIERNVSKDKDIHIICDNYATHKHEKVNKWFERRPRFHLHFTPTSASWLNMVERFFRELADKQLKRGVFHSVAELEQALNDFIAKHNRAPAPYIWTKSASDILEKVKRARENMNNLQSA